MTKLRESANEVLNIYNYFDHAIIIDTSETIVYYYNIRHDINKLIAKDVMGKKLFQIFPKIKRENSTLIKALSGISTSNLYQNYETVANQIIGEKIWTSTIYDGDKIIGAVEVGSYCDLEANGEDNININITPFNDSDSTRLFTIDDIVTECDVFKREIDKIKKVASTNTSVMIYGETGTGKTMFAEAIHTGGNRADKPFISRNCAAIPSTLIESTLFGTTKGSFTGAKDAPGLFEMANGGTLFLDEINNMNFAVQSKLLRTIENHEVCRVGSFRSIPVDVRIIAATNVEPRELVEKGLLREDLYYRLKVIQLNLVPLRERKGDLEILTKYFIKKYNKIMGKNIQDIEVPLWRKFKDYKWPGNVRELENLIHGGFNFAEGHFIRAADIDWFDDEAIEDYSGFEYDPSKTLKEQVNAYEKAQILETYHIVDNMDELIEALDLSPQNFKYKVKQLGLENKLTFLENKLT